MTNCLSGGHASCLAQRNHSLIPFLLFAALFLSTVLFVAPQAGAQVVYGSIVGTVLDPTGAIIPGATVTVTDLSKGITQTTTVSPSGNYEVTRLVPDTYTVKVTFQGFAPDEVDNLSVIAGGLQQVNLTMQPAAAAPRPSPWQRQRHLCKPSKPT
ncbi:MAG: carboxypeptidase-like regulatory domain-containing protein [Terracidiphilus sp.]